MTVKLASPRFSTREVRCGAWTGRGVRGAVTADSAFRSSVATQAGAYTPGSTPPSRRLGPPGPPPRYIRRGARSVTVSLVSRHRSNRPFSLSRRLPVVIHDEPRPTTTTGWPPLTPTRRRPPAPPPPTMPLPQTQSPSTPTPPLNPSIPFLPDPEAPHPEPQPQPHPPLPSPRPPTHPHTHIERSAASTSSPSPPLAPPRPPSHPPRSTLPSLPSPSQYMHLRLSRGKRH